MAGSGEDPTATWVVMWSHIAAVGWVLAINHRAVLSGAYRHGYLGHLTTFGTQQDLQFVQHQPEVFESHGCSPLSGYVFQ
jgi:hypothetical protein